MKNLNMVVTLAVLLGGVVGVCLIRAFFLDPIEQMGWSMFWHGLGQCEVMNLGMVVQSATFLKCLTGFLLVGAASGGFVYFKGKRESSTN